MDKRKFQNEFLLQVTDLINLSLIFSQMAELNKHLRELKSILYGSSEAEPVSEACAQLTQEFFTENTMRLLIICLPKLNLEVYKD